MLSDILETLHFHIYQNYKHQTIPSGDLGWRAPTHQVIYPFDHENKK